MTIEPPASGPVDGPPRDAPARVARHARAGEVYPPPRPGALPRLAAMGVAAAAVLAGTAMIAARVRRRPEGWRRTVGILLRSEFTRFALSAFALRVPPAATAEHASLEARIAERLRAFLASEPDAHFRLEWERPVTIRRRLSEIDVVVLHFAPDGALNGITPHLAAGRGGPSSTVAELAHQAVVDAYNEARHLPEVLRARRTLAAVRTRLSGAEAARRHAERLLTACCLSFEQVALSDPAQRFRPPSFCSRRTLGHGYLSWIARPDPQSGSVDLWVSAHHVGLDGVPLQDLLNRLERAWGQAAPVLFPEPCAHVPFAGPDACHAPGERPVDQLVTFVDLSPVMALRRTLNRRLAASVGGDITFGTLFAWMLSQEEPFRGVRIASTVDIAASSGYERDVDVVSLRAADYMRGSGPWDGFVEYAREFNRLIAMARSRTSPVRAGMQTAGLIPAWAHALSVRADPATLDETFGTLCVTIVRDAKVFVAPMTDLGLEHGFFAIGSAGLPTASGGTVTAITIKGDAGRVGGYPEILQRVRDRAVRLLDD